MLLNFIMFIGAVAAEQASNVSEAVAALSGVSMEQLTQAVTALVMSLGVKLVKVLLIWYVGRWITRKAVKIVKLIMEKRDVNLSIRTFVGSLVDIVSMIVLIIMIISVLGIDTSSFIALFASAGVAVGMALSGTLQNFAGGVMILLFRPFKVGDFIEAQGVSGVVKEIQIFNTIIHTGDNKVLLLPNGPVSTGIINNYSREPKRRLDMTFSIAYGDDFEKAKKVLTKLIAEDGRVLDAPAAPFIELGALSASSINIVVRMWCKQEDYWDINFDLNKKVYETFPKEGLHFPYQTFTVNVNK